MHELSVLIAITSGMLFQGFDRPTDQTHSTRSTVMARKAMVATSQPLATQAGLEMLRRGGNAFDAAVAAAAVLNVVEPMSTGMGGDMFALAWAAAESKLVALNGTGRSSRHASIEHFRKRGLDRIPLYGADAVTVPGAVDGWFALQGRYGKLTMAEVLAPAIRYAEEGFPVSEIIAGYWRGAELRAGDADFAAAYLVRDGDKLRAPRMGEVFRQPDLARTLRILADPVPGKGRDAFYEGEIAARIAACLQARGSLIDREDLARHESSWVEPAHTSFHGLEVYELPPNGQGITVLEMLNILEGFDLRALGHNSAEYLHLFLEAKKLAFADRDRFITDPEARKVPVETLISKDYAARVRARIRKDKALVQPEPTLEPGSDTVYLATADGAGNMVSFINSLFHGFGSSVVVPGTGICLQNRGASFSLDERHSNRIEPAKRPFHTIIPGFVLRDGKPYMAFGVMGGDFQPQGHVQVLLNHILFGMNPQEMGERARIAENGGTVDVESGIDDAAVEALRALGHPVARRGGSFGGFQAILRDPRSGVYHAGSDNRKDGCAGGF